MSAFMVDDSTINTVVNKLAFGRDLDWVRRELKEGGYDLEKCDEREMLAKDMFNLNVKGVNARYGEGEAEQFRPLDFKYRLNDCNITLIQAYKSLSCWLYQCAEGDLPGDNFLYNLMDKIKGYLAEHIVSSLPEYDKAKWA